MFIRHGLFEMWFDQVLIRHTAMIFLTFLVHWMVFYKKESSTSQSFSLGSVDSLQFDSCKAVALQVAVVSVETACETFDHLLGQAFSETGLIEAQAQHISILIDSATNGASLIISPHSI